MRFTLADARQAFRWAAIAAAVCPCASYVLCLAAGRLGGDSSGGGSVGLIGTYAIAALAVVTKERQGVDPLDQGAIQVKQMTKRSNRLEGGLSAILTAAAVGGIGAMLQPGIRAGGYELGSAPIGQWRFGSEPTGGAFCDRRRGTSALVISGREVDLGPLVIRVNKR